MNTQEFMHRECLVETGWLQSHLDDPNLRILDATVFLRDGEVESGRANWDAGHIPNSTFIDLIEEISAPHSTLRFVAPSAEQFARAMGSHGVGDGKRVIVYDANNTMWATRVWWLLRAFGFDNAAVLNGGWKKWALEGRPVSTEAVRPQPVTFNARPRPYLFVSKEDVLRAIESGAATTCLLNSLGENDFRSKRIPTSVNVPWDSLVDSRTGAYLPVETLRNLFAPARLTEKETVILYCGSGISATSDALVLTLLGVPDISIYDGSMQEWTADPRLPIASDVDPTTE